MKFKTRMQGFVFGIVVAAIIVSFTVPAIAAGDGFLLNTVNITADGVQIASAGQNYTLDNGDEVPNSIVYRGTTYLPVRKVGEALGKTISWDGTTSTVVIGEPAQPGNSPTNEPVTSTEYYPGTDCLTYTSVTGVPLKRYDSANNTYVYEYTLDSNGKVSFLTYSDYLIRNDFLLFTQTASDSQAAYIMVKDNGKTMEVVGIIYNILDNEVLIVPGEIEL